LKLAIGTAQFGLPYGIANQGGQVAREEVMAILDYAWTQGVRTLDTAIAYGDSEQRLGAIGVSQWKLVSKLPAFPDSLPDITAWVNESVLGSLERLRLSKLHGLLLHRPEQLLGVEGNKLYRAMLELKDRGIVDKIGISIYGPDELDLLWPKYKFDLVQSPFNIIDRRIARSGWLSRLHQAGVEIHTRSAFLQGLLLMSPTERPVFFNRWQSLWSQWDNFLLERELTALEVCLDFVSSQSEIDHVVVGVDSITQMKEILNSARINNVNVPASLEIEDIQLLNPSNWIR
jgi:aryl-alcohol dehydrogenase-like predicted oxidoreductase